MLFYIGTGLVIGFWCTLMICVARSLLLRKSLSHLKQVRPWIVRIFRLLGVGIIRYLGLGEIIIISAPASVLTRVRVSSADERAVTRPRFTPHSLHGSFFLGGCGVSGRRVEIVSGWNTV